MPAAMIFFTKGNFDWTSLNRSCFHSLAPDVGDTVREISPKTSYAKWEVDTDRGNFHRITNPAKGSTTQS